MSQDNMLEVINKEGWRKEYPLQKNIVYIGSAPTNDITLESLHGAGVDPMHAQLIASSNGTTAYKLINLSDSVISLGSAGEGTLAPRAVLEMTDGQTFILGDFTLVFRGNGQEPAGIGSRGVSARGEGSSHIGLRLSMPFTRLAPNQSLEGIVTVTNQGERTGVSFDLHLEGLDPDCYDIAPGPLLSSGAHKDIIFRIHHRGPKPLAGEWQITIRATAARGYPGEQAVATQVIQVLPFYRHRLRILPAKGVASKTPAEEILTDAMLLTPKAEDGSLSTYDAAHTGFDSSPEDVWNVPDETEPEQEAIKLKAKPAPQVTPEQSTKSDSSSEAEDLWAAPVETAPPPQIQAAPSPQAEDLWGAEPEPLPEVKPLPKAQPLPEAQPLPTAQPLLETLTETESPSTNEPETESETRIEPEPPVPPLQESSPPAEAEPQPEEAPAVLPVAALAAASAIAVKEAITETEPEPQVEEHPPAVEAPAPVAIAETKSVPQPEEKSPPETGPEETPQKQPWWAKFTRPMPFGKEDSHEPLPEADEHKAASPVQETAPPIEPQPSESQFVSQEELHTYVSPVPESPAPPSDSPITSQADETSTPPPVEEDALPDMPPVAPVEIETAVEPVAKPDSEAIEDAQVEISTAETIKPDPGITAPMRGKALIEPDTDTGLPDETETVILTPKSTREMEQFQTTASTQPEEQHAQEPDDLWANQATVETPEQETIKIRPGKTTQIAAEHPLEDTAIESNEESDDWWTAEPDPADTLKQEAPEQRVIKIKAGPPPRVTKKQSSDTDDWWSIEEE